MQTGPSSGEGDTTIELFASNTGSGNAHSDISMSVNESALMEVEESQKKATDKSSQWIFSTVTPLHLTTSLANLRSVEALATPLSVRCPVTGMLLKATHKGCVVLKCKPRKITLPIIYYCEGLAANVISLVQTDAYEFSLSDGRLVTRCSGQVLFEGEVREGLIYIEAEIVKRFTSCSIALWANKKGGMARLMRKIKETGNDIDLTAHLNEGCDCTLIDP